MTLQKHKGLFRRAVENYVANRECEAEAIMRRKLLSISDETLAAYGYRRGDLVKTSGSWGGY